MNHFRKIRKHHGESKKRKEFYEGDWGLVNRGGDQWSGTIVPMQDEKCVCVVSLSYPTIVIQSITPYKTKIYAISVSFAAKTTTATRTYFWRICETVFCHVGIERPGQSLAGLLLLVVCGLIAPIAFPFSSHCGTPQSNTFYRCSTWPRLKSKYLLI